MRNVVAALLFAAAALSPSISYAQTQDGPAEGTQDVAPSGGLTVQEGVITEPENCPDGTAPVLKDGEDPNAPERHYVCPDGSEITVGGEVQSTPATGETEPTETSIDADTPMN
jgi:hypothetical protein